MEQPTTMASPSVAPTNMEKPTVVTTTTTTTTTNHDDGPLVSTTRAVRYSGIALRTILLDLPLFAILFVYGCTVWVSHVTDNYLEKQVDNLIWTEERKLSEVTYYHRPCDQNDMTTWDPNELILSEDATPQDAYEHQLKHGFTLFPNVISRETSEILHKQISTRNYNLTEGEFIDLHKPDHRFGYAVGTEEPGVVQALKEFANHKLLTESVALIMGEDPALIELTQITSAYGAEPQPWHPDVYQTASATRYVRTYGPSYSIFVQLQDTSKAMGATGVCPGTHFCTDGDMEELCEEFGYQLVDPETGVWPAGAALVMNMNSWHRGGGHNDPDALDRVMFLLTFSPRPQPEAETRQVSAGGTWSNREDMWGFTWSDLARADEVMMYPLTYLRSWGIYKPSGANWGIDWISSSCMRVANIEFGFDDEAFETLMKNGGLSFLPSFLQGDFNKDDDRPWRIFIRTTITRVTSFASFLAMAAVAAYFVFSVFLSAVQRTKKGRYLFYSMQRMCLLCGFVYLLYLGFRRHVDSTQWAQDIRMGRRYVPNIYNSDDYVIPPKGVATFPNRHDVLIENRYGARYMGMHDGYIQGHTGNARLRNLVQGVSDTYAAYPQKFRDASAKYIVGAIMAQHGRFLLQGSTASWHWEDVKSAEKHAQKELSKSSMPRLGSMLDEVRHAISDYRFGVYRDAALSSRHMVPFLRDFEKKLLLRANPTPTKSPTRPLARPADTAPHMGRDGKTIRDWEAPTLEIDDELALFQPSSSIVSSIPAKPVARTSVRSPRFEMLPSEPSPGAWLARGSIVEAVANNAWQLGEILHTTARGEYIVDFVNAEMDRFEYDGRQIRIPEPIEPGEIVEIVSDDDEDEDDDETTFQVCEIVSQSDENDERYYDVILQEDGQYIEKVDRLLFRRQYEEEEDDDDDEEKDSYFKKG